MKYDVFISYSRQDQATADHLCKALDEAGVSYWIDREIHGSANFLSEIPRYIKQCRVMIFIASSHSAVSEFTQKEILFALKHHKTIIPYRIGKFRFENNDELDFVFTNVQWKEREADVIASLDKLGLVPKKEELLPPPPPPKRMNLKKVLWTVVVLLLFVGGIFGGRAIKKRVDELQFVRDSLKRVQLYQDSLVQAERAAFVQDSLKQAQRYQDSLEYVQAERAAFVKDSTEKANAAAEKKAAEEKRLAEEKAAKEATEKVERERLAREEAARQAAAHASRGTINGHEWVDLGLSVKWATCNVGASTPSAYGNYYAWGETRTKSTYTEENCQTYNKSMGNIAGSSQYDAACANWGGSWRLPTKSELEELKNNCTWTWTSQGGHNGYKVTGKNGNSIFLPAAGWRDGSLLYYAGGLGLYWSSTPYESDSQSAYYLSLYSVGRHVHWDYRYYGYRVRPVSE